jgi:uncharacterized protein
MADLNMHAIIMTNKHCNLACSYCYVLNKSADNMPVSLAIHIVDELLNYNDPDQPTRFIWHGGEPMLAGIDFYEQICQYISERFPCHKAENYIQTNGILLNDEWINFFIKHDFKVGVSMDGGKEIHDACRRDHGGEGSFDRVYQNVMRARQRGLIVGFLSVITRHSIGHEEEIFQFFYNNRFDFGFHPITSLSPDMDRDLAITPQDFAAATIKFFDLGFRQPAPVVTNVTPTMHYAMSIMMGCPSGFCVLSKSCAVEYLSIEPNGQVQICDRFAGNNDTAFGDISRMCLDEILQSPIRLQMLERWNQTRTKCLPCEWSKICYGGCMHEAYIQAGSIHAKDPNCEAYKQIFAHISSALSDELRKAKIKSSESGE